MTKEEDVFTIYLFGDQTDDCRSQLRSLLHVKHDPLLDEFLQIAYKRVKAEILRRQNGKGADVIQFSSLRELLDVDFKGDCRVAVEHAITSICQFGIFLRQCHETAGGRYPDPSNACLVGLCTGSLTAAAISCCRSIAELVHVAVEVTMLSFSVGEFAAQTGSLFYCDNLDMIENGSWAVAMSSTELPRLENYLQAQKRKVSSQALSPFENDRNANK